MNKRDSEQQIIGFLRGHDCVHNRGPAVNNGRIDACAAAGVEPLPDDEAREQAKAMLKVLVPAFEVTFRQH